MQDNDTPLVLRRLIGSEWTRHMAGHELAQRAAQQKRNAVWRAAAPFLPCG